MLYVLSGALAVLGIVVLVLVLLRVSRPLRRLRRTASMVTASIHDRVALLRARCAAVRVAVAERRRHYSTGGTEVSTIGRE